MVIFLETAELTVKENKDLTVSFWRANVDRLLSFQNKNILKGAGSMSKAQMENKVRDVYEEFDDRRKKYDALEADNKDIEEIKEIEEKLKRRIK